MGKKIITLIFILVFTGGISNKLFAGIISSLSNNLYSYSVPYRLSNFLSFIQIHTESNQVVINLPFFIITSISFVLLFVGATFFFRGKRQRHILHERNYLTALIDNIPDTIYFKDLESKFTRVNVAQSKLLGTDNPSELIGKSDFDFFEYAQDSYDIEQEIIRTGKPVVNKINEHVIDGKTLYLSDTKIPLVNPEGKCIGTVGISRDITDFKITQSSMLESQAKFKALFDNAPLAIFRLDKDMKVIEYNYRFMKMFGYSDDDMINITKSDLLVDPELGGLIVETVIETKEVNTEIMLKRHNGEPFIANLTLAVLEEGFNEISIEGIVEDITQVAKARDEIIKSKDKAIEADNLKSVFLANMSHEIRTPMNAIIGFTNMLREENLEPEEKNSFIDVIQSNGNSLMTLIDAIVDFSKLETGQMIVSISEFNFKPIFESAIDFAQKLLTTEEKSSQIKIIQSLPENPDIRISSDRHRLIQVLNHLISNAIKFTDKGEIEIGYNVSNKKFNIFVKDTGVGIPKSKQRTIFERFAKVNSDKNRLYGGTGIGLTISKGMMKLLNGKIKVDSAPGDGSIFTLELNIN